MPYQLKEDRQKAEGQSDPSIVLRDGRTDHMGKGGAGGLREQKTNTAGRNVPNKTVRRTLFELNAKAKADRNYRFRSLYREINLTMLYECYHGLSKNAAAGVDGMTAEEYGKNLDERLSDLLERLITKRYRAQKVRRRHIPKGKGKTRPLGIPALEDKIVQMAAGKLLNAIYEADFQDSSVGYRPKKGAREATQKLQHELYHSKVGWIVEADIKSFFDCVDHEWLLKMLRQRVDDRAFVRLVRKWLKAGVLEEGGEVTHPEAGTPQGGIISPILANIYLHYALDLWVEKRVKKKSQGEVVFLRYADDFVVGFEKLEEAQTFYEELPVRMEGFGLRLAEEKTAIVRFHRRDQKGSRPFTFLGFDFSWGRTRKGAPTVRRKTNGKKLRQAIERLKEWLGKVNSKKLREIAETLRAKLQGHGNYYGVIGNSRGLGNFWHRVEAVLFRWTNRRSQRRSYTWPGFREMLETLGLRCPWVVEKPYQQPAPTWF